MKTSIFLRGLGLDTPELFWSTFKVQTSGNNGNCLFASMVQQYPFIGETAAALRATFQQYVLKTGVRHIYMNACFPLSLVVHREGEMFIRSFSELQTFVASDKFLEFWIGELELPGVASCFGVANTVLWPTTITMSTGFNNGSESPQPFFSHCE